MLCHEVFNEVSHHVELVVILEVELLALLGLQESEVIAFIALGGNDLFELLHALQPELEEDAFLQICLNAFHCIVGLQEILDIELPRFLTVEC